uniref:Uncharacterized protein n=1 Tax=Klebsiella pneumoniae TaxID=573 RepID=R9R758_KLEPN|nr:hypothetical protein [Klebsiella pneumoniae]AGL13164.1 hypothetical protein [Klebsiella pneumoniae]
MLPAISGNMAIKPLFPLNGHLFISRCVSVNYINRMKPLFFIMADLQGYLF